MANLLVSAIILEILFFFIVEIEAIKISSVNKYMTNSNVIKPQDSLNPNNDNISLSNKQLINQSSILNNLNNTDTLVNSNTYSEKYHKDEFSDILSENIQLANHVSKYFSNINNIDLDGNPVNKINNTYTNSIENEKLEKFDGSDNELEQVQEEIQRTGINTFQKLINILDNKPQVIYDNIKNNLGYMIEHGVRYSDLEKKINDKSEYILHGDYIKDIRNKDDNSKSNKLRFKEKAINEDINDNKDNKYNNDINITQNWNDSEDKEIKNDFINFLVDNQDNINFDDLFNKEQENTDIIGIINEIIEENKE